MKPSDASSTKLIIIHELYFSKGDDFIKLVKHMVPKALVGLEVVTVKTDGWVFTFTL